MPPATEIFNRRLLRLQRERAARGPLDDFLYDEIALRLVERLEDLRRPFDRVLLLDARGGRLQQLIAGRWGRERLVGCDLAWGFARQQAAWGDALQCDLEQLPFAEARFDLVIAGGGLHWVNDLPGLLAQAQRLLTPDGLFLGALIAGQSLAKVHQALLASEIALTGGASPRVAPALDLAELAGLLQAVPFALPVADRDRITLRYQSPMALLKDLRMMGEGNALAQRNPRTPPRALFAQACAALVADDGLMLDVEVLFLSGWRPDPRLQQQPLTPGSAQRSLIGLFTDEGSFPPG